MALLTDKAALQLLRESHFQWMRERYTSSENGMRSIAYGKDRKLKTTNGITAAICDYVKYVGGFANRINTTGRKIKAKSGKEIFIKGTTKRGTPDIDIVFAGLAIKVEVKNRHTKDRVSEKQNDIKEQLEAAGAVYFIAESLEGFLTWFIPEIQNKYPINRA